MRRRLVLATVVAGVIGIAAPPPAASAQIFSGALILPCNQLIVGTTGIIEPISSTIIRAIDASLNSSMNASLNATLNSSLNQHFSGTNSGVRGLCHFPPAVQ